MGAVLLMNLATPGPSSGPSDPISAILATGSFSCYLTAPTTVAALTGTKFAMELVPVTLSGSGRTVAFRVQSVRRI